MCISLGNYPQNAWQHFDHIHSSLHKWLQITPGFQTHCAAYYCGPWIENIWITTFSQKVKQLRMNNKPLSTIFGQYIPLFIPFTDLFVNGGISQNGRKKYRYEKEFVTLFLNSLNASYNYVTVSQNDKGIYGNNDFPKLRNILIFSAGGEGHVPIPLLKQEESLLQMNTNRKYFTSFVGTLNTGKRQRMAYTIKVAATTYNFTYRIYTPKIRNRFLEIFGFNSWKNIVYHTNFNLSPRGFGRTSYHLAEIIQLGRIPIYIYDDKPWIPYESLFRKKIGFVATNTNVGILLHKLQNESIQIRENTIRKYRSYFTYEGVMKQIELFMKDPTKSQLECSGSIPT